MALVQAVKRNKNIFKKLYIASDGNEFLALEYNEKNRSLNCQNERNVKYHFVRESNISCLSSSSRSGTVSLVWPDIYGSVLL
jgi:hypothetical protein